MMTDGSQAGSSAGYWDCGGTFFLMAATSREMCGSSEEDEQLKMVTYAVAMADRWLATSLKVPVPESLRYARNSDSWDTACENEKSSYKLTVQVGEEARLQYRL